MNFGYSVSLLVNLKDLAELNSKLEFSASLNFYAKGFSGRKRLESRAADNPYGNLTYGVISITVKSEGREHSILATVRTEMEQAALKTYVEFKSEFDHPQVNEIVKCLAARIADRDVINSRLRDYREKVRQKAAPDFFGKLLKQWTDIAVYYKQFQPKQKAPGGI